MHSKGGQHDGHARLVEEMARDDETAVSKLGLGRDDVADIPVAALTDLMSPPDMASVTRSAKLLR